MRVLGRWAIHRKRVLSRRTFQSFQIWANDLARQPTEEGEAFRPDGLFLSRHAHQSEEEEPNASLVMVQDFERGRSKGREEEGLES